jgi:uncharacterized protein (DUF362 family)
MGTLDRRDFLYSLLTAPLAAPLLGAAALAPVAIAKCSSYAEDQEALLSGLFDKLGGLSGLVKNKTVTVKLNLTGPPSTRLRGMQLGLTHYTHPRQASALASLLSRAGARRIRFVESAYATPAPLEEVLMNSGWNVRALRSAAPGLELVNTDAAGKAGRYVRFKVPNGATIFPSYMLHSVYDETDVFVSLAKLKQHVTCGVTLSMKNLFGMTPASIYGDDAGRDEPNENPRSGRVAVCHEGRRAPSKIAEPELNAHQSRVPEYRMPRVVTELVAARPIHLAIVDGIETMAGGEGPWVGAVGRPVKPGVVIAGLNPVSTDTVATAVMGFDPRVESGLGGLRGASNMLLLAERMGLGSAELRRIDVRGVKLADAVFPFAPRT